MNILRSIIILILLLATFSCASKKNHSNEWNGTYKYVDVVSDGIQPIIANYELNIYEDNCQLAMDGFQTYKRIICSVKEDNNNLNIMFVSYSNGKIENIYGNITYHPGTILFSIEKRNNKELITTWNEVKPDMAKKDKGIFFEKIK